MRESLFLRRYSATALAQERAFPLAILTLVGGLIVSPEENQQQQERGGRQQHEKGSTEATKQQQNFW